ncbi:MAG TPA: acetolactate synthase [Opitutaceae bacterium]
MADASTALALDPVKQFSVFAENRVGRLFDLSAVLKEHNVHIIAVTVLDTTDSAIVRLIVDDPDKARELMVNNDFPYTECDVLAVEISDEGDLKTVLSALLEAEINIHYIYSFIKRPESRSALVINAEDTDVAAQSLNSRGFKVLTQRDISR